MRDPQNVTVFAEANFRNQRRKFGIMEDDRRRHMYIIGKTGMGKSTLMENMIIDDIKKGKGVAVVDPHGDLVEKVIKFIPPDRVNDVIYFNPADIDYPIAFNILENINPDYKHLIAYGLVGVFKKIWADSWGPRMEYILTNSILALIEYPGSTLLGLMRILVDKTYRKKVVSKVQDPVVKTFWTDEFSNYSEKFRTEAIAPIQNKVGQFLASSIIRNIVGQSKSTLDMREIMDNGKIILMNLSKGRVGEENSALLGAMMITKIQLAAMSRVDMPEEDRRDFYLYVDEFQNFATEAFANILSEARKYRLNLILAHQYVEQLSDEVRAAVFGNVGTMITFRIGGSDAEELEKEYTPNFTAQNLVNIEKYNFFIKLMIDGVSSDPFSAIGLPPVEGGADIEEKVIKVSRERYARQKSVVEERILRWSGFDVPQAKQKDAPTQIKSPQPKIEQKNPVQAKRKNEKEDIVNEISAIPVSFNQIEKLEEQNKIKKVEDFKEQEKKEKRVETQNVASQKKEEPEKEMSLSNLDKQTKYFGKAKPRPINFIQAQEKKQSQKPKPNRQQQTKQQPRQQPQPEQQKTTQVSLQDIIK
ncbi:MAG: type IV secretion system DNA-binding domain-containing protein [Patescibacteria group bacterium]